MAYYNGQASSYQELLDVLVAACVEQGWTWADGILSKGKTFVKLSISGASNSPGILIRGGTGKNAGNLVNASPYSSRLGDMGIIVNTTRPDWITWPAEYNIHIFEQEVFCIVNYSITNFYYLAFGSDNSKSSNWISATTYQNADLYDTINLTDTSGGKGGAGSAASGFFWDTVQPYDFYVRDTIFSEGGWSSSNAGIINSVSGLITVIPLISRSSNLWNQESIFLPINLCKFVASSKTKIVCYVENARYLRIDNYEPKQIIEMGPEKWKVYPFHKKNSGARNGGVDIKHTGTFGWAIRYDGP